MRTKEVTRTVWVLEVQSPDDRQKGVTRYVHYTGNMDYAMFEHVAKEELQGAMEFDKYEMAWEYVRTMHEFAHVVKPVRVTIRTHYTFAV